MKNKILTIIIGIIFLLSLANFVYGAEAITKDEALALASIIDSREGFMFVNQQLMQSAPYIVTSDPDVLQAFAEKLIQFKVTPTPYWIKINADKLPADMQKKLPDVELDQLKSDAKKSQKDAASAESTASAVKYGGIGVVVLVIVIIIALGMRKYGSARTMLTPGGTSLGQQAAAEVTANQKELDKLFRRKQEILTQYQEAVNAGNIAEARRLHGNGNR